MTTSKRARKPVATADCADFDPATVFLSSGSHGATFHGECCILEAANVAAARCTTLGAKYGKPKTFTDDHPSVSRVIRAYCIGLNDAWDDETRQRLRPYVTRILGTATGPEDEETRAWMATDWLARVHAPAWLRLAGLTGHAQVLESLARIADATTAGAAQQTLAAAWDAARAAAWDAARAAAWAAAWDAAWDAARAAAWAAAWDAARDAARAAAWAAAWDAARAAAWDAARAAAGDAARAAARDALQPTVRLLQDAALELLDAMIAVGRVSEAA